MTKATVYIIDDDDAVRDALAALVVSAGYASETFASAYELLAHGKLREPGCIVTDLRMPGVDGLTLQRVLRERQVPLPILLITAHGDVSSAVTALRGGAIDFLEKPFDDEVFLERIEEGLDRRAQQMADDDLVIESAQRLDLLTNREREVGELVAEGLPNKMIALRLNIGVRTVETHRAHLFEKLGIASVPQITRLFDAARRLKS